MSSAVLHDLIFSPGPAGSPGDGLSVAGGELVSVEEPVKASLQDTSASYLIVGDILHLPSGDVKVIELQIFSADIAYDGGSSTASIELVAITVSDGVITSTFYAPIDKQGNFPDIVKIGLNGTSGPLKAVEIAALDDDDVVTLICFAAGTPIRTARGWCPVERLRPGDRVWTLDDGFQPLRWVGARRVAAGGAFAPVAIAPGTFGNRGELVVSPQHRLLVGGWRAELLFGQHELLVPACHLVDGRRIRRRPCRQVTYVHLLFDRHQIVDSDGALSESLYPGAEAARALTAAQKAEVAALFPDLGRPSAPPARPVLRGCEAVLLRPPPVVGVAARLC